MDLSTSTSACCPIYRIIEKMSRKWTMLILRSFTVKKRLRFTELLDSLPEINSRILSERLSEMEEEGLITRTVEDGKPVVISYEITPKGMDLRKLFHTFVEWSDKWCTCEDPEYAERKR